MFKILHDYEAEVLQVVYKHHPTKPDTDVISKTNNLIVNGQFIICESVTSDEIVSHCEDNNFEIINVYCSDQPKFNKIIQVQEKYAISINEE